MNWLWKSSIAKSLLGSFLIVIIPIVIVSLFVNYTSMHTVNKQITTSYSSAYAGFEQVLILTHTIFYTCE